MSNAPKPAPQLAEKKTLDARIDDVEKFYDNFEAPLPSAIKTKRPAHHQTEHLMYHPFAGLKGRAEAAGIVLEDKPRGK